jgi:hypothetical protein
VDRGEAEADFVALEGRQQHVGGVERVDEVGREGLQLLALVDGVGGLGLHDTEVLQDGGDLLGIGFAVWLHHGHLQRRGPDDGGAELGSKIILGQLLLVLGSDFLAVARIQGVILAGAWAGVGFDGVNLLWCEGG